MSLTDRQPKTLRRRLFGSHLLVMVVALAVLAAVVGLVVLVGEGRSLSPGRGDDPGKGGVLLGLIAAAIAAGLVSWRMAKRLAAPLETIGDAARELAAGRYDVRVPAASTVELDALAANVNQLAQELETTEERRLRLIGDVAHELRNPLSTIEGTMEALLDGVMTADEAIYTRIGREAARLRRLADDLSSLSAAGEIGLLNREPLNLAALVTDVVAQLEPQALAKGLELDYHPSTDAQILGDGDRLTQVVMNVVGNAVQYTDKGRIDVQLSTDGRRVMLEIIDTGRGLAAPDQERIFDRFHRVDQHFADGTGVGLAIAKMIVEAHGGSISAASAGPGQGTTVRIDLPAVAGDVAR